ncbi:MAG: hypothetical protein OK455_02100 [Thaumarchaeota archaeon]|nr:hypothetical protein [Nitrososphaerota archaeon]
MKINSLLAAALLLLATVASVLVLGYARTLGSPVIQLLAVLVSMGVIFYASHPLGHFFTAKAYGVGTEYFFVGRSDFRKLDTKPMSMVGNLVPTIGTKLKKSEFTLLPPRKRGYVFGSGVILSVALMGIQLVYVFIGGFNILAVVFAFLFFAATLATEFLFSTKVGDFAKMTGEFKKAHTP